MMNQKDQSMRVDSSRPQLILPMLVLGGVALVANPVFAQSETATSSAAAPLPGEGGALHRAKMPIGGVDDGSQTTPAPDVKPEPKADVRPEPAPDVKPEPKADAKLEPKADVKPEPKVVPTAPVVKRAPSNFGSGAEEQVVGGISLRWNGYMRLLVEATQNDANSTFIGRNDGFKLGNARFGVQASKGDFAAYISLEAASGERADFNDANTDFRVEPKDVYMRYDLAEFAQVTAGRFKTPYDLSSLEATARRTFIEQPVESRGMRATQGLEVVGMATDRQLGIMVSRDRLGLSTDGFDIGYAFALTNGFAPGLAVNDNDRPAAFLRLSGYFKDIAVVNLAAFSDNRTTGDLPNLFDEDVSGVEVSALASLAGLNFEAQFLYQNTTYETSGQADVGSIGAHAQVAYAVGNLSFAYRFAMFDPNLDDIEDADRLIEHTLGAAYDVDDLPLRLLLNGTVAQEQAGRRVSNNRLTLLGQFVF